MSLLALLLFLQLYLWTLKFIKNSLNSLHAGYFFMLLSLSADFLTVSSGLENCTRPLVFTSGSLVRASGNCHLLARQDE